MLRSGGEFGDVLQSRNEKGCDLLGFLAGGIPDFSAVALLSVSINQILSEVDTYSKGTPSVDQTGGGESKSSTVGRRELRESSSLGEERGVNGHGSSLFHVQGKVVVAVAVATAVLLVLGIGHLLIFGRVLLGISAQRSVIVHSPG